jgi:hypothetical protein
LLVFKNMYLKLAIFFARTHKNTWKVLFTKTKTSLIRKFDFVRELSFWASDWLQTRKIRGSTIEHAETQRKTTTQKTKIIIIIIQQFHMAASWIARVCDVCLCVYAREGERERELYATKRARFFLWQSTQKSRLLSS